MAKDIQRIEIVSVVGPQRLSIVWQGAAATDEIDLSRWIASGGETLAPLLDPKIFPRAAVTDHGGAVSWDDGQGDLSIDAHHLSLIAEQQRSGGSLA